jgi:hypothetical protein
METIVQDPAYNGLSGAVLEGLSGKYKRPIDIVGKGSEASLMRGKHTIVFFCHIPFDITDNALCVTGQVGLAGLFGAPKEQDHQEILASARSGPKVTVEHRLSPA